MAYVKPIRNVPEIYTRLRSETSTCVDSLEYDEESETLTIHFVKRGSYQYFNVPKDEADNLKDAGLKGTYFNLYFRPNFTDFVRIA